MIDLETFGKFLDTAQAGERLTYHAGALARDRAEPNGCSDAAREVAREVDRVAKVILEAAEAGEVALAQRRINPSACEYFAIRIRPNGKMHK